MESGQNIQPEAFDANHVSYLLDSAALAERGGNTRLAIHLYCAAFEASQSNLDSVDERALSGLRQAWTLACEQGDRSTAETIFNELEPYNTDEQTQAALLELQEMATQQLGLSREEMEGMGLAFVDEIRDAGIDVKALVERLSAAHQNLLSEHPQGPIKLDDLASSLVAMTRPSGPERSLDPEALAGRESEHSTGEDVFPGLRYVDLAGFERAKEKMRVFGIIDPRDEEMRSFLQEAESFHGLAGPVLSDNFLFVGPSREDSGLFAQATANEIGWPVITMIVEVNELGDGTIKVIAPVRRSFFGPPRLTDLPNPCTLIIQNIDILQNLFWIEEQAIKRGQGVMFGDGSEHPQHRPPQPGKQAGAYLGQGMPGAHGMPYHSLQQEVMGYLSTLMARGGVFVIATSETSTEQPLVISEQLVKLLGEPEEIALDQPNARERQQVLKSFSENHPSFHDLDKESLAGLSEGMSRYELFISCNQAVEAAYRESLRHQRHQMVSLEDVLTQFMQYLDQDSVAYRLVEDYLVAIFAAELDIEDF